MKKISWDGTTLLSPIPATLVSCGTCENPNALAIAWTGITNSTPPMTYVSVMPKRYSHDIIKENMEFVINLPNAELTKYVDYCGVKSGRDENKLEKCGLTVSEGSKISCPVINEFPVNIECKVKQIIPLGSHDMFLAEIVGVDIDETLIDENGRLCLEKAGIVGYSHGEYYKTGKRIGKFGFSVKKKTRRRRK